MMLGRPSDKGPGGISHGDRVTTPFMWWLGLRGVLNRSYVLLSGLYFVVTAHLTAAQLVVLGTSTSLALLLANIPVGVWADAFSRKWLLALGQLVLAAAMGTDRSGDRLSGTRADPGAVGVGLGVLSRRRCRVAQR